MTEVLLIEDNLEHTKPISRVLVASGYAVLAAKNAKTGLQLAMRHHPDIILLDLGLPDIDRTTLLNQIRHVPELTDVPVVAVTAWPPGTNPQLVENAGFDGYLSKSLEYSIPRRSDRYLLALRCRLAKIKGGIKMDTERTPFLARISEDWWAVIIGLALAILVWLGAITHVPWPLFGLLK